MTATKFLKLGLPCLSVHTITFTTATTNDDFCSRQGTSSFPASLLPKCKEKIKLRVIWTHVIGAMCIRESSVLTTEIIFFLFIASTMLGNERKILRSSQAVRTVASVYVFPRPEWAILWWTRITLCAFRRCYSWLDGVVCISSLPCSWTQRRRHNGTVQCNDDYDEAQTCMCDKAT